MKYDYSSFPVLKFIDEHKIGEISVDIDVFNNVDFLLEYRNNFTKIVSYTDFKKFYISKNFAKGLSKSFDKMIDDSVWNTVSSQNGVILNMEFMGISLSVVYQIVNPNNENTHDFIFYFFHKNIFFGYSFQSVGDDLFKCSYAKWVKDSFRRVLSTHNNEWLVVDDSTLINELDNSLHVCLVSYLNFIRYAKVETKILPPKSKTMGIGCYYTNNTKSNITMLDSKWFTTLVKSDAFKVRGHFRLQPKKVNGEWTKELIWINEFEKSGYTAPARKLNLKED